MSAKTYFMLWRNGKNRMRPVVDFKNRLVLYVSYYMAEVDKPDLGVLSPITRKQAKAVVTLYKLDGVRIRKP